MVRQTILTGDIISLLYVFRVTHHTEKSMGEGHEQEPNQIILQQIMGIAEDSIFREMIILHISTLSTSISYLQCLYFQVSNHIPSDTPHYSTNSFILARLGPSPSHYAKTTIKRCFLKRQYTLYKVYI